MINQINKQSKPPVHRRLHDPVVYIGYNRALTVVPGSIKFTIGRIPRDSLAFELVLCADSIDVIDQLTDESEQHDITISIPNANFARTFKRVSIEDVVVVELHAVATLKINLHSRS